MSGSREHENESKENKGNVHIADDVVASVAALAAAEIEGVGALVAGPGVDISELLGKKNMTKGVKLVMDGDNVTIDIFLLVKYGATIQNVARKVQDAVGSAVESMTGLNVTAVNIRVNGVAFEKEPKKQEKK